MTTDYFEAKKTGGSKDSIEITVEVKNDKVVDFANEIASEVRDATIDRVLEIIDNTKQAFIEDGIEGEAVAVEHAIDRIKELRSEVFALKGGEG